jgi:hypothetical protein
MPNASITLDDQLDRLHPLRPHPILPVRTCSSRNPNLSGSLDRNHARPPRSKLGTSHKVPNALKVPTIVHPLDLELHHTRDERKEDEDRAKAGTESRVVVTCAAPFGDSVFVEKVVPSEWESVR